MNNTNVCLYLCKNKGTDQLRANHAAKLISAFGFATDSTIPLLPKSKISSLKPSALAVQRGLCWTRSEIPKTDFVMMRVKNRLNQYGNILDYIGIAC